MREPFKVHYGLPIRAGQFNCALIPWGSFTAFLGWIGSYNPSSEANMIKESILSPAEWLAPRGEINTAPLTSKHQAQKFPFMFWTKGKAVCFAILILKQSSRFPLVFVPFHIPLFNIQGDGFILDQRQLHKPIRKTTLCQARTNSCALSGWKANILHARESLLTLDGIHALAGEATLLLMPSLFIA